MMGSIKLKLLEALYSKEFKKYYRAMSYQILAVEVDALFNVLVLDTTSEFELTRRYEQKVREILNL